MLTMLILGLIAAVHGSSLNITNIDYNSGIYYEEIGRVELYSNEWRVVIFYDLETLKVGARRVSQYINKVRSLCEIVGGDPTFSVICNSTVVEMNHIMDEANQKLALLQNHKRSRRSPFGIVGTLSKSLFGTLNEEDAKFYDRQIEKLRYNDNHLLNLLRNHTVILETTVNIFNKSLADVDKQMVALDAKLMKLKVMIEALLNDSHDQKVFVEMESLAQLTTLIAIRYHTTINSIIDVMTNAKHSRVHPSIFNPEQLENILTIIRKQLPSNTKLPTLLGSNDLLSLYYISHMSTSIVNDKILYEIKIPLPFRENYQLYKVIPLPTPRGEQFVFIQPTSEYILIDFNKEHFYDISSHEFASCIEEDYDLFLCHATHPIFNINDNTLDCDVQLLRRTSKIPPTCHLKQAEHSLVWIQLSQINKWLFSTLNNFTADYICGNTITPYTISGTGIVEMSGNCYLRTPELTISSYNVKSVQLKNFFLPPIDITKVSQKQPKLTNITPNKLKFIKHTSNGDLLKLSEDIKALKHQEEENLLSLDSHDVHHYALGYIILAIVLIAIVYKVSKLTQCPLKSKKENLNQRNDANRGNDDDHNDPPIVFSLN